MYDNSVFVCECTCITIVCVCVLSGVQEEDSSHDFGLHPSDAWTICREEMEADIASEQDYKDFPLHRWHPGRLVYYNRAELKQSDHR